MNTPSATKVKKFHDSVSAKKKKIQNWTKGLNSRYRRRETTLSEPRLPDHSYPWPGRRWRRCTFENIRAGRHQLGPGHPSLSLASPPGFNEGWPGSKLCPGRNGRDIGNTGASISWRGAKLASLPGSKLLSARPSFALEEAFAKSRPGNNISRIHGERGDREYTISIVSNENFYSPIHTRYPSL